MAEIRVERKRGGSALLWILLLLIIAAAIGWYFYSQNSGQTPARTEAPPPASQTRLGITDGSRAA